MILKTICDRRIFPLLGSIFVLTFLFENKQAFGQGDQSLTDTVSLEGGYFLQRDFQFNVSRNDTTLNGRYTLLLRPDLSEGLYARDYEFGELEANFEENQREGSFELRSVSFQPAINRLYPASGAIQVPYSGTVSENRGQFEDNFPAGEWSFTQKEQNAGAAADTALQVQAFFGRGGVLRDQYRIVDRKAGEVLVGRFNEDGALDNSLDVRDRGNGSLLLRIVFEDGLLTSISRQGEQALQPDYHGKVREVNFEERPLDSLYAKIMSYYLALPAEDWETDLQPISKVQQSIELLYGSQSPLLEQLPGGEPHQYPKVKVPVYETTEEEREIVDRKYKRLTELNLQMDSLMHASAFTLNRYADQDLASLYAQMQVLKGRLERQRKFSEVLAGPMLKHIGPDWFIGRRLEEVVRYDTAVYAFNEGQFREPMDFDFDTEGMSSFEQYRSYINVLEEKFGQFREQLNQYLQQVEMDTRLSENENRLTELSEEIDLLADSIELNMYDEEISSRYKHAFVDFKEFLLKEYADMEPNVRATALEATVNCLEQLKGRLENAPVLAEKEVHVDEAYMDRRLNPYTYTEIDVRLFERLFKAYRDNLVPHLVLSMKPTGDCNTFLERADNLERLQDFMLKALNDNPRRLERRIRNQDDPEAIIRKLGVPVVL